MRPASDPPGRIADPRQTAYAALEKLIREAEAGKVTGNGTIRLDFNQGGIRQVKRNLEVNES